MSVPKIVSMYSFKGGAGRTVCTANLAAAVAKESGATEKNPLLLMDMDLDSAGLTWLLATGRRKRRQRYSCAEILAGRVDLNDSEQYAECFERGMLDVSKQVGASPGSVRFLGTGTVGRREFLDFGGEEAGRLQDLFEYSWEMGIRTVLIDSASGRQQAAELCHRVSDVIVYCCRMTRQFKFGTEDHLRRYIQQCVEEGAAAPNVMILPVAVPEPRTNPQKSVYKARQDGYRALCAEMSERIETQYFEGGISEVDAFKWNESVLAMEKALTPGDRAVVEQFQSAAQHIARLAGD